MAALIADFRVQIERDETVPQDKRLERD